ncbi:MAG: hypothetical protein RLZZ385_285 [Pseudomonadota bacterium]
MNATDSLIIQPLLAEDAPLYLEHIRRHLLESNRTEGYFMPHDPGNVHGPRVIDTEKLSLPVTTPGWQRWWVVKDGSPERIVGHVDPQGDRLNTGLHRCELGIGIERDYRGQGLGLRLMHAALDFARRTPSLHWVELKVFASNTRAIALYESLGFTRVGLVPDRFRIQGQAIDDIIMILNVS